MAQVANRVLLVLRAALVPKAQRVSKVKKVILA